MEDERIPAACNIRALDEQERQAHRDNAEWLWARLLERRPLDDALALRFPDDSEVIAGLARFVDRERACCPFFAFEIRLAPQEGLWLRLTGEASAVRFAHEYVPDAM